MMIEGPCSIMPLSCQQHPAATVSRWSHSCAESAPLQLPCRHPAHPSAKVPVRGSWQHRGPWSAASGRFVSARVGMWSRRVRVKQKGSGDRVLTGPSWACYKLLKGVFLSAHPAASGAYKKWEAKLVESHDNAGSVAPVQAVPWKSTSRIHVLPQQIRQLSASLSWLFAL